MSGGGGGRFVLPSLDVCIFVCGNIFLRIGLETFHQALRGLGRGSGLEELSL